LVEFEGCRRPALEYQRDRDEVQPEFSGPGADPAGINRRGEGGKAQVRVGDVDEFHWLLFLWIFPGYKGEGVRGENEKA